MKKANIIFYIAVSIEILSISMWFKGYVVENIKKMAVEAVMMLLQAVQAYVEKDMKKAREVLLWKPFLLVRRLFMIHDVADPQAIDTRSSCADAQLFQK